MTEQQYARANRRVMLAAVIIFGYVALTMATALAEGWKFRKNTDPADHIGIGHYNVGSGVSVPEADTCRRGVDHYGHGCGICSRHTAQFCKRDLGICGSSGHCRDDIHEHAAYDDR